MTQHHNKTSNNFSNSIQLGIKRGRVARSRALFELIDMLTGKSRSK